MLIISFQKPQHADQSEMEDNVITHYAGEQIVGITMIHCNWMAWLQNNRMEEHIMMLERKFEMAHEECDTKI